MYQKKLEWLGCRCGYNIETTKCYSTVHYSREKSKLFHVSIHVSIHHVFYCNFKHQLLCHFVRYIEHFLKPFLRTRRHDGSAHTSHQFLEVHQKGVLICVVINDIFTHGPRRWNRGSSDGLFLLLLLHLLLLHTTNFGDWVGLYCVLYCTVLYCIVLYCTVLYCTVLYCTVLYHTIPYCKKTKSHTPHKKITPKKNHPHPKKNTKKIPPKKRPK